MVTVAALWLSRRWKRALWGTVTLLVLLRLVAVALPALDVVMALGAGPIVCSLILLLFGSPTHEPLPELLRALWAAGLDPGVIEGAEPRDGALRYNVVDCDGSKFVIRNDENGENDADLLNRLHRGVRSRASEVRSPSAAHRARGTRAQSCLLRGAQLFPTSTIVGQSVPDLTNRDGR